MSTPHSELAPAGSCSRTPAPVTYCKPSGSSPPVKPCSPPSVTKRLIAEFAARPDPQTPPEQLAELTGREREVLRHVAAGLSNADIGRRLVISPLTAKTHVARILAKLDCHDRAQLVTLAYETGLVTPGSRDGNAATAASARVLRISGTGGRG
jgi:DNA-binding CsgD family transcriptional regulator